jgi:DNA-directed RNA polymerase III subunit RPC3
MSKTVINNICTAILNLRLRRQHEVEVGKTWMDRASATDENESEEEKLKYQAFCKGLERLDSACLQLDETLMVLKDL